MGSRELTSTRVLVQKPQELLSPGGEFFNWLGPGEARINRSPSKYTFVAKDNVTIES